jgi:hypothetical protein
MGGWATTNDAPYGNPFGPSIGLRGGLSIYGVYVGVVYVGWAGQGEGLGAMQLGGQLGFGARLLDGRLTIRPERRHRSPVRRTSSRTVTDSGARPRGDC